MSSRFRNELTIVPTARIKVSRHGLSTTIDWAARAPGANGHATVRFGVVGDPRQSGPLPTDRYLIPGTRKDFGGGDVAEMTSPGLNDFKSLLVATQEREREIRADAAKAKRQLVFAHATKMIGWASFVSVISKSVRAKVSTAVDICRSDVATLRDNLMASRVSVSFDMETSVAEPHRQMLDAFDRLAGSQRSWTVNTAQKIDRVKARSVASTVISRATASLARRSDHLVDTTDLPLYISIQNGKAHAYFYPGFILIVSVNQAQFAVIDLKEVILSYKAAHFTETETVPGDATMLRKVWAKSNKNGSRDKRFKNNRELPEMLYGQFLLTGPGGLNELFMFSRNDACSSFVNAVNELRRVLASAGSGSRLDKSKRLLS